jgi:hypothetical protein
VDKLLENSLIKLSVLVSGSFGASGRAIIAALIAGERAPAVLADLTRGSLRSKTARLTEALTGRSTEHHAFLLTQMLAWIDGTPPTSPPCRPASRPSSASSVPRSPSSMRSPAWDRRNAWRIHHDAERATRRALALPASSPRPTGSGRPPEPALHRTPSPGASPGIGR